VDRGQQIIANVAKIISLARQGGLIMGDRPKQTRAVVLCINLHRCSNCRLLIKSEFSQGVYPASLRVASKLSE
jgi:hypothetical protein